METKKVSCTNCRFSYEKDDRARSRVCKSGRNYNFGENRYLDIGEKCKDFVPLDNKPK